MYIHHQPPPPATGWGPCLGIVDQAHDLSNHLARHRVPMEFICRSEKRLLYRKRPGLYVCACRQQGGQEAASRVLWLTFALVAVRRY